QRSPWPSALQFATYGPDRYSEARNRSSSEESRYSRTPAGDPTRERHPKTATGQTRQSRVQIQAVHKGLESGQIGNRSAKSRKYQQQSLTRPRVSRCVTMSDAQALLECDLSSVFSLWGASQ